MLRELDLYLLRTFVTVTELGGFTAAAAQLNRTQSAVSMQIRKLEEFVGHPLLVRGNRTVRLTVRGESLLDDAKKLLRLNDEALAAAGEGSHERVRLGIPDAYARFLPTVLPAFHSSCARLTLEVYCGLSTELLPMVRQGELDLAVATRQMTSPGGQLLRRERLMWVAARGSQVHLEDPLPLALYPEGVCEFREAAVEQLETIGRRWYVACCSPGLAGIAAMVRAGLAVTVMTENTLAEWMRPVRSEEGLPPLHSAELALHVSEDATGRAVKLLARHLHEAVGNLGDDARDPGQPPG